MFFFFTISASVAYTIIVIMLKVIESVSSCPRTAFILTVLLLILMIIEHVIGTKRMVDLHNHKASVASSAATTMTARSRTLVNRKDNSKQHVESSDIRFLCLTDQKQEHASRAILLTILGLWTWLKPSHLSPHVECNTSDARRRCQAQILRLVHTGSLGDGLGPKICREITQSQVHGQYGAIIT